MAEIIEAPLTWGSSRYPWDLWLDGQARKFTKGEDFPSSPVSFVQNARTAAKTRNLGLKSKVETVGDTVYVIMQAVQADLTDLPAAGDSASGQSAPQEPAAQEPEAAATPTE